MGAGESIAIRIEDRDFAAQIACGDDNFCVIASAGHGAEAVLKKLRLDGRKVRQRIGGRIPQGQKRFSRLRLAQAHHQFAVRKREQFFGPVEHGIGQGLQTRDGIAGFDLQRGRVDGNDFPGHRANPNGCAVCGEVRTAGSGDVNLRDTCQARGRKNFDAVHRAVGNEQTLVCGIVGNAAVARLAGRVVHKRRGIRAGEGGARESGGDAAVYSEAKVG